MTPESDLLPFEMTRQFHHPRAVVWEAWSKPQQLAKWWGPKGSTVQVSTLDFRPGGFCHFAMRFEHEATMWARFNYRDITAQEKIVWLTSFSNERCGIARAPFSEACPLEIE